MTWFQKEMDYARESLESAADKAIDRAQERLSDVVREGVGHASQELQEVIQGAGREIDLRLDKISAELHNQRQFTKDDVRELVDYAAKRLSTLIDDRLRVAKEEFSQLVQDKVEYLKSEVDEFFVRRQEDLARERRRLMLNVVIAVSASLLVGVVSLIYHRYAQAPLDLFGLFRILFASLTGGYGVYLLVNFFRRYRRMEEHQKDAVFLAMRYWGVLRPESLFSAILVFVLLSALSLTLMFPGQVAGVLNLPWLKNLLMP
jgi:F0F1-type ATP synthase membrane subunit b/b'